MIYFDMDGVLVDYNPKDYVGDNPAFLQYGNHYFRNLVPDENIMYVFKKLIQRMPDDVYVITSVNTEIKLRNEQILDKIQWLMEHVPEFDVGQKFIAVSTDKRNVISSIRGSSLRANDILVDDYNGNLYAWENSGGSAIKYLNGINSENTWPGLTLDSWLSKEELLNQFQDNWYACVHGR